MGAETKRTIPEKKASAPVNPERQEYAEQEKNTDDRRRACHDPAIADFAADPALPWAG